MRPGRAKSRNQLPWLPYPKQDEMYVINAHNFGRPWTPADIATSLWLDAADSSTLFDAVTGGSLPANGVGVARWEDKSGNGRHVTQATSGNRPTRSVAGQNSLDILSFNGTSHRLANIGAAMIRNVSGYSIYAAGVGTSTTADRHILAVATATGTSRFNIARQNATGFAQAGGRRNNADGFQSTLGSANINFAAIWSATVSFASTTLTGWINGTQWNTNASFQTSGVTPNDGGDLYLGSNTGSTALWQGSLWEIIAVNTTASTTDRQIVEGYLAHKWGLQSSLPSGHPYRNNPPTI